MRNNISDRHVFADRYAGDEAWGEWFKECSVFRCGEDARGRLADEVGSAMAANLGRLGMGMDEMEGDDPVAFFDSYFAMKTSRDKAKPLKSYFRNRIESEEISMRDFVCGTLFGSSHGRVRNIVRDWISTVKGWKARSFTGADGARHLVWEQAAADADAGEALAGATGFRPGAALDRESIRKTVRRMLETVAKKIKAEIETVAFLLYMTALNVPVSSGRVLARMGLAKSRASLIRNKCMKECKTFLNEQNVDATDILLPRVLFAACGEMIAPEDRAVFAEREVL